MRQNFILHLTGMRSTKYGALETYLLELSKFAAREGFRTVIQYEEKPSSHRFIADCISNGVTIAVDPINKGYYISARNLWRLFRSYTPAIVHAHFLRPLGLITAPYMARMVHTEKIIKSAHGPISNKTSPIGKQIRKLALIKYDRIIAVSSRVRDSIIAGGVLPEHVSIHYLGVKDHYDDVSCDDRFTFRNRYRLPPDAIVIGCIAFDHKVKGLDILLEALGVLCSKGRDVYALIIGVEASCSALTELAEKHAIGDRIRWAGIVDEAWRLLPAVDVYVQPSRSEGGPLAVMEAMSLKLPVVITTGVGVSEVMTDHVDALIAEAENPRALASALGTAADDKLLAAQLGASARSIFLRKFSLESSAKTLVSNHYLS